LQSAAFLSFQRLGKEDAELLKLVSDLTPSREYYPPNTKSAVAVKWNSLPVLSQHHSFYSVVLSIFGHANDMQTLYRTPDIFKIPDRVASFLSWTASRNKVYYPQDSQHLRHLSSSIPKDAVYDSRGISISQSTVTERAAYQMSWSVWNDRPCLSRKWRTLWKAMQSWKSLGPSRDEISLRFSLYWLSLDPVKDWLGIYNICQETLNRDPRETKMMLAFSLSAACFRRTNYKDIVPLILIFATDTRFRGIVPPSTSYYDLSDGTYPDHKHLVELMSRFALPLEDTPAQTMAFRGSARDSSSDANRRLREYNKSIKMLASKAARSAAARWPEIWCDLSDQWFDTKRCRERVEAYFESISRNATFKNHILRLQAVLSNYEIKSPPKARYAFSSQFRERPPKPPPPSLRDILTGRPNFPPRSPIREQPLSGFVIPSTVVTESEKIIPPSIREDGLRSLIQELVSSQKSLQRTYGEDLNKSYNNLLGKRSALPVGCAVPPQEELRHYRDLCFEQMDTIFSELSEALAPSQKQEHVLTISGLWPRITPRSVLRELSRDRVRTLPNRWKCAITRYAVAFLKYQQSRRLLELWLSGRDEELLREAETPCEDVAGSCSPDWLLIQVSQFPFENLQTLTSCVVRLTRTSWRVLCN